MLGQGAILVTLSRHLGELSDLKSAYGDRINCLIGDVTNSNDLETLAAHANKLGPVDYLVPNAGVAVLGGGLEKDTFARNWPVNGLGALNTLAALRDKMAKPASVVFIGTFLSQVAFAGLGGYIASKAALTAQARTLAFELAAEGVRVNVVSPGPTATPILSSLGMAATDLESIAQSVNQRLINGKFLEPKAVADVVLFMLSSASRGIYGQNIVVDGGYALN